MKLTYMFFTAATVQLEKGNFTILSVFSHAEHHQFRVFDIHMSKFGLLIEGLE
jgi:hypothetical protein